MNLIRLILGMVVFAALWAWYRISMSGENGFTNPSPDVGGGSVTGLGERGSAARENILTDQLSDAREAAAAVEEWRDTFANADEGPSGVGGATSAADDCAAPGASCPWDWATSLPAITRTSCDYPYQVLRCETDSISYMTAKWVNAL